METKELLTSFAASKNSHDMKIFSIITLLFIVAGCSSLKVNSDYDKSLDFNSYKSFTFLEWSKENISLIGNFDAQRLINGVKAQMLDRGYGYKEIGGDLSSAFLSKEFDEVYLSYNQFFNPLSQKTVFERILPIDPEALINEKVDAAAEYIFEPQAKELLNFLIPHFLYFYSYIPNVLFFLSFY